MGDDDRKSSPRERAKAYLQKMLRTASLVTVAGCGDDGSTASSDPCAPDGCDPVPPPTTSDTDGTASASSTTGGLESSTTWDDPCAEDGCDPPPPPETSTGVETDTGTGTGTGTETGTDTGTDGTTGTGSGSGSSSGG
jgi:hypothetical protein